MLGGGNDSSWYHFEYIKFCLMLNYHTKILVLLYDVIVLHPDFFSFEKANLVMTFSYLVFSFSFSKLRELN